MEENELSKKIIGAAIEVHSFFGPGLLESVYEAALCHELNLRKIEFKSQVVCAVKYKNAVIKEPFYLDILVENKLIVELKATNEDHPIFKTQLLTYLRITNLKLGLLINFGKGQLKDGITRVVNNL